MSSAISVAAPLTWPVVQSRVRNQIIWTISHAQVQPLRTRRRTVHDRARDGSGRVEHVDHHVIVWSHRATHLENVALRIWGEVFPSDPGASQMTRGTRYPVTPAPPARAAAAGLC